MDRALPEPSEDEVAHSARLADAIRGEITASGPISFARFMERCLYAPGLGYYSAGRLKFGKDGDFVTAPELGPLFARCVARALAPGLRACGEDAVWFELGGGSGAFTRDVLLALQALDALPRDYWLLEPSADLRERQRERLQAELPAALFARCAWLDRPPQHPWSGVLFANEVLDALPITRFTVQGGEVFEEHVDLNANGAFVRVDRPADALVAGAVRHLQRRLGREFEDGYRSEVLPQLPWWLEAVAGEQARGAVLFIDYGYVRREFYLPERRDGTLLCHYRHRAHDDPLILPGLQDITASIDFTALAEAGIAAGYEPVSYAFQSEFLIGSGLDAAFATARDMAGDEAARYALAQQVKRLTLPGEMGERFQAMLFARDLDIDSLFAPLMQLDRSERL
ncbi:MAG TPA: SAM-dependent methyltransferase [Rhodanobacteraceae bacterium]|jgi:SAM-dependent MidA family methyltransferase|nr:SAM-dependent methyltransferase [Rhodanobacteraceae bacterium]